MQVRFSPKLKQLHQRRVRYIFLDLGQNINENSDSRKFSLKGFRSQ